jgi:hypothetical protein
MYRQKKIIFCRNPVTKTFWSCLKVHFYNSFQLSSGSHWVANENKLSECASQALKIDN